MTRDDKPIAGNLAALMNELQVHAAVVRQPLNGTFELTQRCNLNCAMCYVRQPVGERSFRAAELSPSQWLELALEAKQAGMVFLVLTGGEVFLRPDFFDVYEPLTRLGLVLSVFTNGTLVTDETALRLSEAPPSRVDVTLYGATAATYEAITGVPGSYARCCAGIESLVRHGLPLRLKTTLTQQNVAELDSMRAMAEAWGTPFTGGWLLSKRRDKSPSRVCECRLTATDCVALEASDKASARDWAEVAHRSEHAIETKALFPCPVGRTSFFVTSNGRLNVCVDLPFPAALPLKIGFDASWKAAQDFVDDAPPLSDCCRGCEFISYCSRCPAWSFLETNTLTDPVPYLCDIAKLRRNFYSG